MKSCSTLTPGELLLRHNLYLFEAQGTVYTEAPDKGARQLVSFVGDTTINTAAGWMGTSTVTTGNNVEAYLDTNADNAPDNNNGRVCQSAMLRRRRRISHFLSRLQSIHGHSRRCGDESFLLQQHHARLLVQPWLYGDGAQLPGKQLRPWRYRKRLGSSGSPGRLGHKQRKLRDTARRFASAHATVSVHLAESGSR
jgi:hypothetical protein